jgi:hypothetical protein
MVYLHTPRGLGCAYFGSRRPWKPFDLCGSTSARPRPARPIHASRSTRPGASMLISRGVLGLKSSMMTPSGYVGASPGGGGKQRQEYVESPFAKTVVHTLANNRNPADPCLGLENGTGRSPVPRLEGLLSDSTRKHRPHSWLKPNMASRFPTRQPRPQTARIEHCGFNDGSKASPA